MQPYRPPEKIVRPPPGPRLNMFNYTYPEHFDIGAYPRVKQLNTELLRLYKQIGNEVDQLSRSKEECEFYGSCSGAVNSYFRGKVKSAQADLKCSIDLALGLLAEVDAIGAQCHIPDVLQDKIKMKKYVTTGALAYLAGANFYFAEDMINPLLPVIIGLATMFWKSIIVYWWHDMIGPALMEDAFLNFSANHKDVLLQMSCDVNRITFLQECGNAYCGSAEYRGFYFSLKLGYEELLESNFQMNTPPALMDRVRQILLSQDPKQARKERMKRRREEKQEREEEEQACKRERQVSDGPVA